MNMKKILMRLIIITLVIASAFFVLSEVMQTVQDQEDKERSFPGWLQGILLEPYLPGIHRMNQGTGEQIAGDLQDRLLLAEYPVFLYKMEAQEEDIFSA